ncbi:MAG: transglycosylase domain-containing protein, partial [Bacteroidales bacterium]|nr:transglycosylase domain-containing protein [Bacteroidales bacterium]
MNNKLKKTLKTGSILLLTIILLFALFFLSIYMGIFGALPNKIELADIHKEEASLVFSSDGSLLGKYFAENRTNISRKEIPDHLINALIATEDKRFYQHEGYDIRSYLRVFFKSILMGDRRAGGGSTITQQLIKNIYGRNYHNFLSMPINKVKEAIIASRMEAVYTKEEILVLYLNSVPFGENVYGIEAAATRYFDKHTIDLNIQESAILIGILKANTYYNPRLNPDNAKRRRNQVLALMEKEDFLSEIESDSIKVLPLELSYANYQKESPAAYFMYQVKRRAINILETKEASSGIHYDIEKDGLKIYTSLDIALQDFSQNAVSKQLKKMQGLLDKELKRNGRRQKWEKSLENIYSNDELSNISKREVFEWDGMKTEEISLADSLWHYHKMLNAAVLITDPKTGKVLTWVGGNHYRYLPYDMVYAKRQIASA